MASVTYVSAGTEGSATSGNVTPGAPGSTSTDDILICVVHSADNVSHSMNASYWTQIAQGNGGSSTSRISIWWGRIAAGESRDYLVTHSSGGPIVAGVTAYRGAVESGSPVHVSGTLGTGTDSTMETTGQTTTEYGAMLVAAHGMEFRTATHNLTQPAGWTCRLEDSAASTQNMFQSAMSGADVTFVSAGTEGSAASGNVTPGAPAGTATGDVLICAVHSTDQVSHSMNATYWTQIYQGNGGGTTSRLSIWWGRIAASESRDYLVTHTSGDTIIAGVCAYRNCIATGSPIDVSGTGGSGTDSTMETTGVTTTTDGAMLVAVHGAGNDNTITAVSGWNPRLEDTGGGTQNSFQTTLGTDGMVGIMDKSLATAGTQADITVTQSLSNAWASYMFALRSTRSASGVSCMDKATTTAGSQSDVTVTQLSSYPWASYMFSILPAQNRYWVAGTGNWSNASGHWAQASGGTPASDNLPTNNHNVFFNSSSNNASYTVYMDANGYANSITTTAPSSGNLTFAANGAASIILGSNINFYNGHIFDSSMSSFYFRYYRATTGTITTNSGNTAYLNLLFQNASGSWQFTSNITSHLWYIQAGSVNAAGIYANSAIYALPDYGNVAFNLSGANVYSIGNMSWRANNGGSSTLTLTTNSSTYITFDGGNGYTMYGLNINGTFNAGFHMKCGFDFTGSWANTLILRRTTQSGAQMSHINCNTLSMYGSNAQNRLIWFGSGPQRQPTNGYTITAANLGTFQYVDFVDTVANGASAPWNLTAITGLAGDGGGNQNISFATAQTCYLVLSGSAYWDNASVWKTTSGGASSARIPLAHDNVVIDSNSYTANDQLFILTSCLVGNVTASGVSKTNCHIGWSGTYILRNFILDANLITSNLSVTGHSFLNIYGDGTSNTYTLDTKGLVLEDNYYYILDSGITNYTLSSNIHLGNNSLYVYGCPHFNANGHTITTRRGIWFVGHDIRYSVTNYQNLVFNVQSSIINLEQTYSGEQGILLSFEKTAGNNALVFDASNATINITGSSSSNVQIIRVNNQVGQTAAQAMSINIKTLNVNTSGSGVPIFAIQKYDSIVFSYTDPRINTLYIDASSGAKTIQFYHPYGNTAFRFNDITRDAGNNYINFIPYSAGGTYWVGIANTTLPTTKITLRYANVQGMQCYTRGKWFANSSVDSGNNSGLIFTKSNVVSGVIKTGIVNN